MVSIVDEKTEIETLKSEDSNACDFIGEHVPKITMLSSRNACNLGSRYPQEQAASRSLSGIDLMMLSAYLSFSIVLLYLYLY